MNPYTCVNVKASVALDTLLRHVSPRLPEIPYAMALDSVRQAYTEFARRSSIIVDRLVQDYQAGVTDYPLEPPEGYEVYQVMGIESPGFSFVDYWAGYNYGLWNTRFDVIDNRVINFRNAPSVDSDDGLVVFVQLLPNPCCDSIPSSIATPYGKGIADGALASLLSIPNKPWTNSAVAAQHRRDFNITIMAGRNLADTNRKRGPLQAKRIRVV